MLNVNEYIFKGSNPAIYISAGWRGGGALLQEQILSFKSLPMFGYGNIIQGIKQKVTKVVPLLKIKWWRKYIEVS